MNRNYQSWGRYPKSTSEIRKIHWRSDAYPCLKNNEKSFLPYGCGRSYGDSCLNDGGVLLDMRGLNRFINFDSQNGYFQCEAGVTLAEVMRLAVPKGWFLAVTPGTKYITIGGAIANDVHGKNQHNAGTFGCHVCRFELLRSDGQRLLCSLDENPEWFKATIGGLGLTGVILWAEFKLKRIQNPYIAEEFIVFSRIEDFFRLSDQSKSNYDYFASWLDCMNDQGHGVFFRGNHAQADEILSPKPAKEFKLPFPLQAPNFLLNRLTIKMFNSAYYNRHRLNPARSIKHFYSFFYPLDAINNWNRMYGRNGFFQYQCVIPYENDYQPFRLLLKTISDSGLASFLCVLKVFDDIPSPGLLSFPRKGVTLALDFPIRGRKTLNLLNKLDEITRENGGAIYPAKDARMSPECFRHSFSQLSTFMKYVDPNFSSSFWRRVMGDVS
ncbi:FAD-dependent oxidoreductase [Nitrospinota bacterium]